MPWLLLAWRKVHVHVPFSSSCWARQASNTHAHGVSSRGKVLLLAPSPPGTISTLPPSRPRPPRLALCLGMISFSLPAGVGRKGGAALRLGHVQHEVSKEGNWGLALVSAVVPSPHSHHPPPAFHPGQTWHRLVSAPPSVVIDMLLFGTRSTSCGEKQEMKAAKISRAAFPSPKSSTLQAHVVEISQSLLLLLLFFFSMCEKYVSICLTCTFTRDNGLPIIALPGLGGL